MLDEIDDPAQTGIATSVDDLTLAEREVYWRKVVEAARGVFDLSDAEAVVARLRRRLSDASPQTQLFFFHRDPFQVAADLCQIRPIATTRQQSEAYLTLLAGSDMVHGDPDDGVSASPRP